MMYNAIRQSSEMQGVFSHASKMTRGATWSFFCADYCLLRRSSHLQMIWQITPAMIDASSDMIVSIVRTSSLLQEWEQQP